MMPTNIAIQIHLLRKQPEVWINETLQPLDPPALRLLIILADEGEPVYDREDLIHLLYGAATAQTREAFRKRVLPPLRKMLPEDALPNLKRDQIQFPQSDVFVDSRVFDKRAAKLMQSGYAFGEEECREAESILALYQAPFLGDVLTKLSEGAGQDFASRQKTRREELATRYHELLERVVEFLITRKELWGKAQQYAEQWFRSPTAGTKPLHYLIWLGMQQHSAALHQYMEALRDHETNGDPRTGRTWAEWNEAIRQERTIPLDRLFSSTLSEPDAPDNAYATTLTQLIKLLTTPHDQRVFGLVGAAGSGKSEMARTVLREMRDKYPGHPVVLVELTTPFDLVDFCNSLLMDMGRHDLLTLDIGRKKQRLKQLMQQPNQVVIIDEGYSEHLANPDIIHEVRDVLHGARVLLVARHLPPYQYYELALPGFNAEQVRAFLVEQVSWLKESSANEFSALAAVTFGLPLALSIIAGGVSRQRVRLPSLIAHLNVLQSDDETRIRAMYQSLIAWLWRFLQPQEKNVLFTMSLFAPETGVSAEALDSVLRRVSTIALPSHLRNLIKLHVVKMRTTPSGETVYSLHPLVLEFVQQQTKPTPHVQRIRTSFARHLLDFVMSHHGDYVRLDDHKQNLLPMLDVVLTTDQYPALQASALEVLNLLQPYLERSGLYTASLNLLTRVVEQVTLPDATRVELLFRQGKLAKFVAKYEIALDAFAAALTAAQRIDLRQRYGALYNNIGDVLLQKGRYADALRQFEHAETWAQATQNLPLLYTVWSNSAVCYFFQGLFEAAQANYLKVAEHLGEDFTSLSEPYKQIAQHNQNALGTNAFELGNYAEAVKYFQRGLDLAHDLGYQEQIGFLYINLGVAYFFLRDYAAAHGSFMQARAIAEHIQHPWLLAEIHCNQGTLASAQFLHADAFRLLRQALIEVEDNHLEVIKPRVFTALGKAYLRIEQYDSAHSSFLKALLLPNISLKHAAHALYGLVLSSLLKTFPVGDKQVSSALIVVDDLMRTLPINNIPFFELPEESAGRYLKKAEAVFQQEFDHFPELTRYCIADAFLEQFAKP
ncbi:MAG: tetratricopeptide repeat protein [Anaerolinea sp.]|nr:tetratricopeptide repeat protein [Anaerolinea sp.]